MGEEFYFATITTRDCSLWDYKRGVNKQWVEKKTEESLVALDRLAKKPPTELSEIFEDFILESWNGDEDFRFEELILTAEITIRDFYENLTKGCVGFQKIWHADGKMRVQVLCGDISTVVDERILTIIRFENLPREILNVGGWD